MKNRILVGAVLTAALAGSQAVLVVPATAAPETARAGCSKRLVIAEEKLNVRKTASASSDSLGTFPKGAQASCSANYAGGDVTACGSSGNTWTQIKYGTKSGYVPFSCVKFVDPS
ncbi:SH3 domain-containing protein [Kribbella solani]|uniref:SH3 domain-containing protein n=1 Tax=Kribbella solani TaxID=236067 RepID=UPI0029AC0E36|nr:SH3 domain-containing protein [Kribbella solani]MDX3001676.1 SH3 domain-containing protein [Kribbella solani]